ncbi:MAG: hypothetical protein U0894_18360, partial [Pirellulales bacterium]
WHERIPGPPYSVTGNPPAVKTCPIVILEDKMAGMLGDTRFSDSRKPWTIFAKSLKSIANYDMIQKTSRGAAKRAFTPLRKLTGSRETV